jgi:uncharacterized protein YcfJ
MKNTTTIKYRLAPALLLALWAGLGHAGQARDQGFFDHARVLSSTPVYQEVNDPRRECWTERVETRESARDRSYGGAVLGGLVGGILGNQMGKGNGRKAATVFGATTGAIVGDRIDNDADAPGERNVERCRSVDNWTRKVAGYDVVYRYQGHDYTTHLPYDPGPEIKLRVDVRVAENW